MDTNLGLALIGYRPGKNTYSLPSTLAMANSSGMEKFEEPEIGDIRFNYRDGGGHVCIVINLEGSQVVAVSGNSHDMCDYMRYDLGTEVAFLTPWYKKYMCNPLIVLDCAGDQVGYTEGKGNMTPFGSFTGANGSAWCASFLSWCFYHAYQPVDVPVEEILEFFDYMEEEFGEKFYEELPYKEAIELIDVEEFNPLLIEAIRESDDEGYFQPEFFKLEWEAYGDPAYSELGEWTSGTKDTSAKISSYKTTSYKQKLLDEGGTKNFGDKYDKRKKASGTTSKGSGTYESGEYNLSTLYRAEFDGQIWGNSQLAIYVSRLSNGSYFARSNRASHVTVHNAFSECSIQELAAMCNSSDKGYNYGVDSKGTIGLFVDEQFWTNSCDNWENDMFGINIICSGTSGGLSSGAIEKLTDLLEDVYRRNFIYLLTYNGNYDDTFTFHSMYNPGSGCPGSAAEAQLKSIAREVNGRLSAKISTNFVQVGSRLADSEANALRTQSLINVRQIRPYIVKINSGITSVDVDYLYASGVVGAFIDVGTYDSDSHFNAKSAYRTADAIGTRLPYGYVMHSRASDYAGIKQEAYWMRFIISSRRPKLGVWLCPNFTGGSGPDLVDAWYSVFVEWGLKSKCGLYCSSGQASNIGWPRQANYMALWLSDGSDGVCPDDELLTPAFFKLGSSGGYGSSGSNVRTSSGISSSTDVSASGSGRNANTYSGEFTVITNPDGSTTVVSIPQVNNHSVAKKWESYTAITNKSTMNYKLTHSDKTTTDELGFRKYDDRYLIAVGSGVCAQPGTYIDVKLANGTVIPCIMGDGKADIHTDSNNIYTNVNSTYCCSEFIVDRNVAKSAGWGKGGDASKSQAGWDSPVVEMTVYNKQVASG